MPKKLKQHKDGPVKKTKIKNEPDFASLQRVKDRLTKQQHDRKKDFVVRSTNERIDEIRDALNAPDAPILERGAAHEAYRTQYFAQFKKVVDNSDVLLEILDSRDPMGCRSTKLENYVLKRGKRVVLILNKCDLIPVEVLNRWLAFLRKEFPALPFKATTNPTSPTYVPLHDGKWRAADLYGSQELISLLNRFSGGSVITAGVFGAPNVGKSSLINSISHRNSVGVASTPGFTKSMQAVQVTNRIRILDCPGVVPSSGEGVTPSMVLRNAIKVELLTDPITPVSILLEKVPKEQLVQIYGIESYGDADDFLDNLARKFGRLRKHGEPDLEAAARSILEDWNKGRIQYFTVPPAVDETIVASTELVDYDGTAYRVGHTMDFNERDFQAFQIQHVFNVVNKTKTERKQAGEAVSDDEDDMEREKTVHPGDVTIPEDQADEMDQLAAEFQAISFEGI